MFDAGNDGHLLPVARDGGGAALGCAREKGLPLRLPANLEPVPGALGDIDTGAGQARMAAEQPLAERHPETLDLGARVLPGGGMDQTLQRFAWEQPRRPAVDEGVGEIPFETTGDSQVAGVVPIAAADDSQHAEVRLAVAAGADTKHARTITHACRDARCSSQGAVTIGAEGPSDLWAMPAPAARARRGAPRESAWGWGPKRTE